MPAKCIVCTEIIDSNYATLKTCGHVFHYGCLQQWITQSKTCPTCRIKTNSGEMLKLFVEEVLSVEDEKLVKDNEELIAIIEATGLQIKEVIETLEHDLEVERKLRERTSKELNKESGNCTTDLTDNPPSVPESQRKGLKRRKSADDDCTIDLTDSRPPTTKEPRKKRSKKEGSKK